ncbi:MAG: CvpA family protein [Cyclobacteriaceae bacterium]|nr:CvpA family protein [Cyclobacteriaceae bacterium]
MSTADIIIALLIIVGAFAGYKEGFLMELISVIAILLGVFAGFKLMGEGMILLEEKFNADTTTLPYISFAVIFIIIVVLVNLAGKLIKNSIDKSFLGKADQGLGAVLGAFKTIFMLSIALWIADSLKWTPKESWTVGSWLYPFTAKLAPRTAEWIGGFLPIFKEIFRQF